MNISTKLLLLLFTLVCTRVHSTNSMPRDKCSSRSHCHIRSETQLKKPPRSTLKLKKNLVPTSTTSQHSIQTTPETTSPHLSKLPQRHKRVLRAPSPLISIEGENCYQAAASPSFNLKANCGLHSHESPLYTECLSLKKQLHSLVPAITKLLEAGEDPMVCSTDGYLAIDLILDFAEIKTALEKEVTHLTDIFTLLSDEEIKVKLAAARLLLHYMNKKKEGAQCAVKYLATMELLIDLATSRGIIPQDSAKHLKCPYQWTDAKARCQFSTYDCPEAFFTNDVDLNKHIRVHHAHHFYCFTCNFPAHGREELGNHMAAAHGTILGEPGDLPDLGAEWDHRSLIDTNKESFS